MVSLCVFKKIHCQIDGQIRAGHNAVVKAVVRRVMSYHVTWCFEAEELVGGVSTHHHVCKVRLSRGCEFDTFVPFELFRSYFRQNLPTQVLGSMSCAGLLRVLLRGARYGYTFIGTSSLPETTTVVLPLYGY